MGYGKFCKRYQKRLFGSTIFAQIKGQYMMTQVVPQPKEKIM